MDSFLQNYVSNKSNFTHVVKTPRQSNPNTFDRQYYTIPSSAIDEFYDLYLKKIREQEYSASIEKLVYICEFSDDFSHVFFDFDFDFDSPEADITDNQVENIVNLLENIIRKYVTDISD